MEYLNTDWWYSNEQRAHKFNLYNMWYRQLSSRFYSHCQTGCRTFLEFCMNTFVNKVIEILSFCFWKFNFNGKIWEKEYQFGKCMHIVFAPAPPPPPPPFWLQQKWKIHWKSSAYMMVLTLKAIFCLCQDNC